MWFLRKRNRNSRLKHRSLACNLRNRSFFCFALRLFRFFFFARCHSILCSHFVAMYFSFFLLWVPLDECIELNAIYRRITKKNKEKNVCIIQCEEIYSKASQFQWLMVKPFWMCDKSVRQIAMIRFFSFLQANQTERIIIAKHWRS